MATSHSPNSSQDPSNPLSLAPPTSTATRRLPPPCWSHEETVALIDSYRDKWYSLRRGNLRATHWEEVADGVAARCPSSSGNPQKTSIQCRHKMEKLRKRYRSEIQRAAASPRGHRYSSSWVHFKRMDSMEKGSDFSGDPINLGEDEEQNDDNLDDLLLYPRGIKQAIPIPRNQRFYSSVNNGVSGVVAGNGDGNGFRIKIPGRPTAAPLAGISTYNSINNRVYDDYPPSVNKGFGFGKDRTASACGRGGKRTAEVVGDDNSPAEEMVAAIKNLAEGFVRMEKMKMDMAKELESMRMEMEMKRTEMILDSQQRLVDSFLEKKKKMKRMPTPES